VDVSNVAAISLATSSTVPWNEQRGELTGVYGESPVATRFARIKDTVVGIVKTAQLTQAPGVQKGSLAIASNTAVTSECEQYYYT
jgi:hypothetical protein